MLGSTTDPNSFCEIVCPGILSLRAVLLTRDFQSACTAVHFSFPRLLCLPAGGMLMGRAAKSFFFSPPSFVLRYILPSSVSDALSPFNGTNCPSFHSIIPLLLILRSTFFWLIHHFARFWAAIEWAKDYHPFPFVAPLYQQ